MTMKSNSALIESMKDIVEREGKEALKRAEMEILSRYKDDRIVSQALRYFAKVTLGGALPVFPALISLSCEAVKGKTEKTTAIGTAIILMAGAADVHDDVIDKSVTKGSNLTVFGKFGKEIAILVGDALLIHGLLLLQKECESISKKQGEKILNLVAQASLEISQAEALETRLKGRFDFPPSEYFEIIRMKAVVPELSMKIGAILGNGDAALVETLGRFGRTFGILSTVAEDFVDLSEYRELRNRLKNECLPLPFLSALQNSHVRTEVLSLLKNMRFRRDRLEEAARIILKSQEVQKLKNEMRSLAEIDLNRMSTLQNEKPREELETLLLASLECLENARV
jgi:heptaprenyl diphosphate synthase